MEGMKELVEENINKDELYISGVAKKKEAEPKARGRLLHGVPYQCPDKSACAHTD